MERMVGKWSADSGINRIRLEFKGVCASVKPDFTGTVLIESDWNLKSNQEIRKLGLLLVLIESDWNLKQK